ncbi:hypothetical protein HYD_5600 [Candidatus Hydrogenosomobacter endosymbioticus]|uniref:Phospholipid/glycerol acyltransferase domain-containing protein n=2 Tax=Candidatus Hydrogenosomobacter endosymbioticus TaxID=2558174 RepID=A0ABM7V9I3_9PROT|nr:hypothetical protein HYD_5600 [Candidatus Hydrogenosomobacter endosymbioticus]
MLFLAKALLGIKVVITGIRNIPNSGSYIIASKHQSAFDTIVFSTFIQDPAFFFKKELLLIPFFGLYLKKLKMIPVYRGEKASAKRYKKTEAMVKNAVNEKRPIIMFPEGTRVSVGQKSEYKSGVFHFYVKFGVPVVPVALNSGEFWPRRRFIKTPGTIKIVLCRPLRAKKDKKEFMKDLKSSIEGSVAKL